MSDANEQMPLSDIACEVMKAARGRWASYREMEESTGLSYKTVRSWADGFERNGVFKSREGERRNGFTVGKKPIEFTVSSSWGGL